MRKIIHIDCDCFYAAVEIRDNPALQGLPVAIGGSADRRGVLSTCNYEARKFGLHSAMPTKEALRLCPALILLPHRFAAYREASLKMRDIFYRFTDIVEPLSLDEAYLDVSECTAFGGIATDIAKEIRRLVEDEVGITASAGIAPNKFLAKVASDWKKPNQQTVIKPGQMDAFIKQLAVRKIPGVGSATMKKMQLLGIATGADLQQCALNDLALHFGAFGQRLFHLAQGIDNRAVLVSRVRKSLSVEHTYAEDLQSLEDAYERLPALFSELTQRLSKLKPQRLVHKCVVKVKFADFSSTTKEISSSAVVLENFASLLEVAFARKDLAIRLLGIGVVFRVASTEMQLPLFEDLQ